MKAAALIKKLSEFDPDSDIRWIEITHEFWPNAQKVGFVVKDAHGERLVEWGCPNQEPKT